LFNPSKTYKQRPSHHPLFQYLSFEVDHVMPRHCLELTTKLLLLSTIPINVGFLSVYVDKMAKNAT